MKESITTTFRCSQSEDPKWTSRYRYQSSKAAFYHTRDRRFFRWQCQ